MSLEPIRREVVHAIGQTRETIREAEHVLVWGDDRQKVEAAGELDFLKRHQALLEQRLREIEWRMAGHKTLFSWLRQAWFNFVLGFESWIAHG
jgi:hypothetical protein